MKLLVDKCSTMGDGLCYLPALAALAASQSITRITLITSPITDPIFRGISDKIEQINVAYDDTHNVRAARGLAHLLPLLWGRSFDVALHTPHSQTLAFVLAWALRVPLRIGFASLALGYRFANRRLPLDMKKHIIDLNMEPVRELLGQPGLEPQRSPPRLQEQDLYEVNRRLEDAGISKRTPFILMHRGARNPIRQWPFFDQLPTAVERLLSLPVLEVVETLGSSPACQLGGLTFGQFAALTARASAMVCNNSGPMHLAGTLGIPTVVFQGPSALNWDFYWLDVPHRVLRVANVPCAPCDRLCYYPPRCTNSEQPMACLRGIGVDQVVAALQSVLGERNVTT